MLVDYLFVFSHKDGTFPVRLRIIREVDSQDISDSDELTGTVATADVETIRAELEHQYKKPGYDISRSWANTWKAVQNNDMKYIVNVGSVGQPRAVHLSP